MSDSRAIAGGLVTGFATGANVANIGAVATAMGAEYGVSLTVVGLFTTALFVTHTAVMIPGGRRSTGSARGASACSRCS